METQTLTDKRSPDAKAEQETSNLFLREVHVLGGGLVDGVCMTAANTQAALQDAAASPIQSTKDYVINHWQDAAIGAGISILLPKNLASKALTVYALQGVWGSTLRAGSLAMDTSVDLKTARNYYAESLSTEATAMVKALPATILGGVAGRAVGNTVFGANNGALDMLPTRKNGQWIPGSVTLDTVSNNLTRLGHKINPRPAQIVFTDMDNTLLDFSTYKAKGLKEGIGNMSTRLRTLGHDIPEPQLFKLIGKQMDTARSHDYPWSVELALGDRLKVGQEGGMPVKQFRAEVVEPFWQSIDNSRATHLKLFPGVEASLQELKRRGTPVVIVSDAPAYAAMQRSVSAGLDKYIDGVYALNNMIEPKGLSSEMLAFGRERVANILATPNEFKFFKAVPKAWEKPSPNSFNEILAKYGENGKPIDPRRAIMIGDSRIKDVGGAKQSGMVAVWRKGEPNNALWAEYGLPGKPIEDIMLQLSEAPAGPVNPGVPKVYPSTLETATGWNGLLKYLDPKPDYSHLATSLAGSFKTRPPWQSALAFGVIPATRDFRALSWTDEELLNSGQRR